MAKAKERIDIEALLEWAYRIQCVDRQVADFTPRGPSASPVSSLGQVAALGCRIDNSGFAERALGVRLPDDALIIHDAVLALGEMWIEWRNDDCIEVWDRASAAAAGYGIGAVRGQAGDWLLSSDGAAPVLLERAVTTVLVVMYARSGTRPEYHHGWRAPEGRPVADDGSRTDRRGRSRRGADGPSLDEVMHARAIWTVWRSALVALAADLDGVLAGYDVTGPEAPVAPWVGGRGRVLEVIQCQNSGGDKPLKIMA